MSSARRRIISSSSLKPSHKPKLSHGDSTRQQQPSRHETTKLPRTTMHTEAIRGLDQMTYSYSFQENGPNIYEYEKQLFSKFLQSRQLQWMAIVSSMADVNPTELLNLVRIGDNAESIYENKLMAHFIGVWLISMGYLEKETKQRVIENVELLFGDNSGAAEITEMMYDSLFQGHLPTELQMKVLLQVCRRGWEYFTFFACRLIRLLKKMNNSPSLNLYQEIEKAIENK